jgi:hypothetical protein
MPHAAPSMCGMAALTRKGADYAYDRPSARELQAAGITAVMRYITDPGPSNKGLTIAEVRDLSAHKISFGLVWELGSQAVLKGSAQGAADAKNAQANLNALAAQKGGPARSRPIYFAIDFDIVQSQLADAEAYFRGVVAVLGVKRVGVYGSGMVIDYLFGKKLASFGWYVKVATGWGGGHKPSAAHVHVQQTENAVSLGGGTIDRDEMLAAGNWGQKGVLLSGGTKATPTSPKADPEVHYTVVNGDNLSKIAAKYRTSLHELDVLNPSIADLDKIFPGSESA